MYKVLLIIGHIFSFLMPYSLLKSIKAAYCILYTGYYKKAFSSFGVGSKIMPRVSNIVGGGYIRCGSNCFLGRGLLLTAWDHYNNKSFMQSPSIQIGDDCHIGDNAHITAINKIQIGNHVLTGRGILITDNSHGQSTFSSMSLAPHFREMHSKGPVVIGDNVWIGENVCIMPNVTIGDNSIIAANSVVTKSVPSFCVAAGIPARVIKKIENEQS